MADAKSSESKPAESKSADVRKSLDTLARKLAESKSLRTGSIAFRLSGSDGGDFCIQCSQKAATLIDIAPLQAHSIEVIGDARLLQAIIERRKDARKHFLAGGFRIRGDIRYLSDLALELGILKEPI